MEVILLERIAKLGQMGDIVSVKNGYARNFLLPQKKALRANKANKAFFEAQRIQLEARNLETRKEAEKIAEKLQDKDFTIIRSASETGHLYGSVSTRNIADALNENGFSVNRNQIALNHPFKDIGLHKVMVSLHPEVEVAIIINIARSAEEAEQQMIASQKAQAESEQVQKSGDGQEGQQPQDMAPEREQESSQEITPTSQEAGENTNKAEAQS